MQNIGSKLFAGLVFVLLGTLLYVTLFSDGLGKAPKITVTTAEHKTLNLSKPLKPVLVNFWATSCPGCVQEMPKLAQMKKRLGNRFELIAVSMNYDPPSQVQKFINANHYPFTFVMDTDNKIAQAFGKILLTPTSFLIAPDGTIVYQTVGELDFKKVETRIKQMSPQL